MNYLLIRTDKPEAEIFIYKDSIVELEYKWQANRKLANELLSVLKNKLAELSLDFNDLSGIGVYKGPGSFTGLRIGITTANALAYSLNISVVSETGENWQEQCLLRLNKDENEKTSMPNYGAKANITKPKK